MGNTKQAEPAPPWPGTPKHRETVRLWLDDGEVTTGMAVYGGDGYRPHWELSDRRCVAVDRVVSWAPMLAERERRKEAGR